MKMIPRFPAEPAEPKPADPPQKPAGASPAKADPEAEEGDRIELPLRYFSRDAATDKYGNVYTEELLNKQIQ